MSETQNPSCKRGAYIRRGRETPKKLINRNRDDTEVPGWVRQFNYHCDEFLISRGLDVGGGVWARSDQKHPE